MEINLQTIKERAVLKREENSRFKEFLKTTPTGEIDLVVFDLNQKVSAEIDCTSCANCCKILEPPVDPSEMARLAEAKGLALEIFETEYVGKEPGTNVRFLKCQPCIFLKEKKCGIYEHRPASCEDYPHLTQTNFKYRWKSVMTNYAICPIVFNVVEALKSELKFSSE